MTEWIDLNAPHSRETRQLARTLRESRIARVRKQAIGFFSHSRLAPFVHRVYTPALADTLGWFLTFAAGLGTGAVLTILAVAR